MSKRIRSHADCEGCIGAEKTPSNERHIYGPVVAVHCGHYPQECNLTSAKQTVILNLLEREHDADTVRIMDAISRDVWRCDTCVHRIENTSLPPLISMRYFCRKIGYRMRAEQSPTCRWWQEKGPLLELCPHCQGGENYRAEDDTWQKCPYCGGMGLREAREEGGGE